MTDDHIFLTPAEAESLLFEGDCVHAIRQGGFAVIGCDWSREEVLKAFASAKRLEIGGPACQRMGHPIAVTDDHGPVFFAADMDKVAAMEAAKIATP